MVFSYIIHWTKKMSEEALLIDVSGNDRVKLALTQSRRRPKLASSYPCTGTADFTRAIEDFLAKSSDYNLVGAAVSACGWEQDGGLAMPNDSFRIQREWLRDFLKIRRLNLVNDCVCIAMAVEHLEPNETVKICGGEGDAAQPKLLIGASFGLGEALIISDDLNGNTILPCEGGHSDLPAITPREKAVLEVMEKKFGRVSRERAVSLQGLMEIWRCLGVLDGQTQEQVSPNEIVDRARAGDPRAKETLALCVGWLATTASDAALMTGARGGIYLAGCLIDLIRDDIDYPAFTTRFQNKGRLAEYVSDIPVYIITAAEPELIGLSSLFL